MKKLLPILVVLALIGGGAYLYFNQTSSENGSLKDTVKEKFEGSLETAVSRGVPVKCEWEDEDVKVTTWVKGENIYSETVSEGEMQYAIMKDNCTWTWGEASEQAVKFCFDEVDYEDFDPTGMEDYQAPEGVEDIPEETAAPEYSCVPTTISDDKFDPPSDVNFMSF